MSGITRRTLLRASATALGLTAADGAAAAHAGRSLGAELAAHEEIVRDARMVWRRLPDDWRSAPFFGSGRLTTQIQRGERANELDVVLSDGLLGTGDPRSSARLVLTLAGAVTAVDWTLDLWNAELTGTVTTTRGGVAFTALTPAERHVLLVELAPSSGEAGAGWQVRPPAGRGGIAVPVREWRDGTRCGLVATLVAEPGGDTSAVDAVSAADRDRLVAAHRDWWHAYYRRSLVSLPDKRTQRFFWIQLFKAASTQTAARNGTPEPFLHTTNHGGTEMAAPWTPPAGGFAVPGTGMRSARPRNPVDAQGLPELWSTYRHSMDRRVLRERLYPALAKVLTTYEPFLIEGPTGALHLPLTHSPGYGEVADCTYDLSLLRWAARRAVESATLLNGPAADLARWRRMSTRLVPYHRDASGVLVGAGVPLTRSNPVPAHLLWLYPLRETRWDRHDDRDVMRRSFDHWASMPEGWHGRSYATASSMAAAMGAADQAHSYLSQLLHRPGADTGLTDNTRYREGGRGVDAGAYAVARSILDMLIRCGDRPGTGSVIDVFPAVHVGWRDISVAGLRTEGAFVVDASRVDGRTEWIRVRGEAGGPLVVRHHFDGPVDVWTAGEQRPTVRSVSTPEVALRLAPGQDALLTPHGAPPPDAPLRNVAPAGSEPPWGLPTADRTPGSSVWSVVVRGAGTVHRRK